MTEYYVDGAVGNDGNGGLAPGAGNAWATISNAFANIVAGDKVWIKDTGTYTETVTLSNQGTSVNTIVIEGYQTTPGDLGKVTWTGATTTCITSGTLFSVHYLVKNIIFTGCSAAGVTLTSADIMTWFNCEFNSNGGVGVYTDQSQTFLFCEARNNSQIGFRPGSSATFIGCISSGNGDDGYNSGTGCRLAYKCVAYGNTGDGFSVVTGPIIGCTVDGQAVSTYGFNVANDLDVQLMDNIVYDCATAGINLSNSFDITRGAVLHTLFDSNTANYTNPKGETYGYGDVIAPPGFTDEATGDYTLTGSSAAIGAGIQPGGLT